MIMIDNKALVFVAVVTCSVSLRVGSLSSSCLATPLALWYI